MEKRKSKSIFIVIFVIILIMISNYCNATSNKYGYFNIDNSFSSMRTNGVCLSEIKFENLTDTSNVFGVTGEIENEEDIDKNIVITLNFYDKYYNIVAVLESTQYIRANETLSYNNFENISEINDGYSVDDIKYYNINVNSEAEVTSSENYDYEIDDYKINMVVNENNTFDITETITANFNVAKHGIFRKIPLRNSITRLDGTKSNNRAIISNISVNENYSVFNENGYKVIKIGDANKNLTGSHTYTIKYTYNIGKDPVKDADELYFNLIGNEWDTIIKNVSFNILMPKSFDKSSLGFSSGIVGSTDNSNVIYNVNGNNITGSIETPLKVGEGLTVRLTLPEEYFLGENNNIDKYCLFVIAICVIFVFLAYCLWSKYGKDNEVVETVEFYPPDGYNSAEVNFLYKGSLEDEGAISLLIYLANQGYIKIEETEEQELFSKTKGFKIIKIKEYDGNNEYERMFFDGLFKTQQQIDMNKVKEIMKESKEQGEKITFQDAIEMSISTKKLDSVTKSDLYDKFYITLNNIKEKINTKENRNKIFESLSSSKIKYLLLMIMSIIILLTIKPIFEYRQLDISAIIFISVFVRNWFYCCYRNSYRYNKNA